MDAKTMSAAPKGVFTAAYWKSAKNELRNVRVLAFAGLIAALAMILECFPVYLLGPSLKIYFSFLVISLGCRYYGPAVGMMVGAIVDTLGFLLSGYGEPYFPGYLVTAMLSGLIYGVGLYQKPLKWWRVLLVRIVINYGNNVLLGSVWKAMLYGKGYYYYFTTGLTKNTILLPVEVMLTLLVLGLAERQGLDKKYLHK